MCSPDEVLRLHVLGRVVVTRTAAAFTPARHAWSTSVVAITVLRHLVAAVAIAPSAVTMAPVAVTITPVAVTITPVAVTMTPTATPSYSNGRK